MGKSKRNKELEMSSSVESTDNGKDTKSMPFQDLATENENLRQQLEECRGRLKAIEAQRLEQEIREEELTIREKELQAKEKWLSDAEKEYGKKAAELTKRESCILKREKDAESGFQKEQEEIIATYREELRKLKQDISNEQLHAVQERNEAVRATEEQRTSIVKQAEEMATQILENARSEANEITNAALQEKVGLAKQRTELQEKLSELEEQTQRLSEQQKMIDLRNSSITNTIVQEVEKQYKNLLDQHEDDKKRIAELQKENQKLRKLILEFEKAQRNSDGRLLSDIIESEDSLKEQLHDKERKIFELSTQLESFRELVIKADAYDELQDKYSKLLAKIQEIEQQRIEIKQYRAEYVELTGSCNRMRMARDAAEAECEALNLQVGQLRRTVENLKEMAARPTEREARIRDIRNIEPLQKCTHFLDEISELEWLERIYSQMCESGIQINKRLFYAFHTSLKTAEWSPITVLSGVSGTGKSMLPKLYARYGGLYFLPLAVQPDWDSSQSLFGFFNALDNKFNATTLLSAMVQFQKPRTEEEAAKSFSDSMMIVLLDEMNLAHVELYFSELLSKLEDRRGETKDTFIEVDLGSGLEKYQIELSRNILWVGTMNEDETTKSLSDKVIDRSNMLGFRSPERFARRSEATLKEKSNDMLPFKQWNKWIHEAVRFDDPENECDVIIMEYKKTTEKINEILGKVGRGLGHRVWQAIENYISNHPSCIDKYNKFQEDPDNCREEVKKVLRYAFEEAMVYKIMPKLRGIEITSETRHNCFDPIGRLIQDQLPNLYNDYENACREDQFIWRSANYLGSDEIVS